MFSENDFIIGKSGKSVFLLPAVGELIIDLEKNDSDCAMNLPFALRADNRLDEKKFEAAVNRVVRENDVLRAVAYIGADDAREVSLLKGDFNTDTKVKSNYKTRFLKEYRYVLSPVEVGGGYEECREKVLSYINASIRQKMELENDVPFRIDVYKSKEDNNKYWLAFYVNHYICDPSTLAMLVKGVFGYYFNEASSQVFGVGSSFMAYLEEISDYSDSEKGREISEFWKKEYEGYEPIILRKKEKKDISGLPSQIVFDKKLLDAIAKKNKTSIFNIIILMYHMAYRVLFETNDSSVAFAVNGRKEKQYVTTLGCFIQVVNSRLISEDSDTIEEICRKLRNNISTANTKSSPVLEYNSPFIISYQEVKDLGTDKMPFTPEPLDTSYLMAPGICFSISEGDTFVIGQPVIDQNFYSGKNVKAIVDIVLRIQNKLGELPENATIGELLSDIGYTEEFIPEVIDV